MGQCGWHWAGRTASGPGQPSEGLGHAPTPLVLCLSVSWLSLLPLALGTLPWLPAWLCPGPFKRRGNDEGSGALVEGRGFNWLACTDACTWPQPEAPQDPRPKLRHVSRKVWQGPHRILEAWCVGAPGLCVPHTLHARSHYAFVVTRHLEGCGCHPVLRVTKQWPRVTKVGQECDLVLTPDPCSPFLRDPCCGTHA